MGVETGGVRRGASLGTLKSGDAGGINLGEVARTTRVIRSDPVPALADRWLASEVLGETAKGVPPRYSLGAWIEDID